MKKTTGYYLLEVLCLVLLLVSIILIKKLITDPKLEWIKFLPGVFLVPIFILERKRQNLQKIERQNEEENTQKEILEKLEFRQDESPVLHIMYEIATKACLEIQPLLTKYNLIIDSDYAEEDDIFEVDIHSANIKGKRIYFSALSSNNEMLLESKEINVSEMSESEIISYWIEDIEAFFSKINPK